MIVRKYETKSDCVDLFVNERFNLLDSTLITETSDWYERWSFVDVYDETVDEIDPDDVPWFNEDEGLKYFESMYTDTGAPAWNYWFEPNGYVYDWCEEHLSEVCACGFVAVMHDDEFWGLAVDGAGYSFRDTHFTRLYDCMGLRWHE